MKTKFSFLSNFQLCWHALYYPPLEHDINTHTSLTVLYQCSIVVYCIIIVNAQHHIGYCRHKINEELYKLIV